MRTYKNKTDVFLTKTRMYVCIYKLKILKIITHNYFIVLMLREEKLRKITFSVLVLGKDMRILHFKGSFSKENIFCNILYQNYLNVLKTILKCEIRK